MQLNIAMRRILFAVSRSMHSVLIFDDDLVLIGYLSNHTLRVILIRLKVSFFGICF